MQTAEIGAGKRVDWPRIIEDLRRTGLSVEGMSEATGIPRSTLLGYRNLDAEPKHADGEALLNLWRRRMMPPLPLQAGSVRTYRAGWNECRETMLQIMKARTL